MATEKNITMREFNGTDYNTLYPKTIASQIPDVYSKTEILTTETLTKYGLTADKLPNDVFQQIKTLIDNTQQSAESKAKIQTGSYVGTGTSGSSNPCSLTFDFVPKMLIFFNIAYYFNNDIGGYPLFAHNGSLNKESTEIWLSEYSNQFAYFVNNKYAYNIVNWGKNTTWYCYNATDQDGAGFQKNDQNITYYYLAIG